MISTLPVELQAEILSHLPLEGQLSASQVCPSWHALLNTKSLASSRYLDEPHPGGLRIHHPHGVHRLLCDMNSKRPYSLVGKLSCDAWAQNKSDALKLYYIPSPEFDLVSEEETIAIDNNNCITESPFLDEPFINPAWIEERRVKRWMPVFCIRIFTKIYDYKAMERTKDLEASLLGKPLENITVREIINFIVERTMEKEKMLQQQWVRFTFWYGDEILIAFAYGPSAFRRPEESGVV
ncbi:hypothetical protein TWF481_000514 [Arthrobotrys musiformis]|uniref:F-box domain-containing protein n=1 Tax=Arthrobotrys musiformis TaxID=47236 RepID=A0AAV9WNX7_9PEZI